MQERKNLRLFISLLVLTSITVLLFIFNSSRSTSDIDKDIFKIADQVNVDRVLLEGPDGKIDLRYNRVSWQINEKYEADRQLIKVFFATIYQSEAKRKITGNRLDSLRKKLTATGTRVKLMAGEEMMKDFWVLGNPQKSETYYKLNSEEDVYVVTIPGYRVYLASVFELKANDWRDKRIFNFNWQNFNGLTATFPSEPQQNFKILYKDQFFGIEGMPAADTTRLNNYLDAVSLVQADRILTAEEADPQGKLISSTPEFQLEVTDIANRSLRLRVFSTKPTAIAQLNDSTYLILNQEAVENIGRRRNYFLPK